MNKNTSRIFIIGPMGAGKSTLGRELARALGMRFYDLDRELELRTGVDVSWIYDVEGEEGFCEREMNLLQELAELNNVVIATGGGTILSPLNRKMMAENGLVIYLYTELDYQMERTSRNQYNRPLLRGENLEERIQELNQERIPLYEEAADVKFLTDSRKINLVVEEILAYLKASAFT